MLLKETQFYGRLSRKIFLRYYPAFDLLRGLLRKAQYKHVQENPFVILNSVPVSQIQQCSCKNELLK